MDLVGGSDIPLKNMSSSIAMMTFPRYGKVKSHQLANYGNQKWELYGD